jgi:rhodanese-related sulfurtransferase
MKEAETLPQISISPHQLQRALREEPGALLLDVRTPAEFYSEHISGARVVPLGNLAPAELLKKVGSPKRLFVICQSGARARKAIERFEKAGFTDCCLVEGGMDAWIQAKLHVVRNERMGISVLRQVQMIIGFFTALGAGLALMVDPLFAIIPLISGCGLVFAGATGMCGLALILAKMPWNRSSSCAEGFRCESIEKGTA